jgi:hypothetical protein
MLAHFYIEVRDKADWVRLELILHRAGYGHIDVNDNPPEQTLEEIEVSLKKRKLKQG